MLIPHISKIIESTLAEKVEFTLETPPSSEFGDFACNVAMILAKKLKQNPRELAEDIAKKLEDNELIKKAEVAGPGFINLFLAPAAFHQTLTDIEQAGSAFGKVDIGKHQKTLLEFISANPTGPLTIANGRGGFGGDVLARVLERAGYEVAREFYVNDAGKQIDLLGRSIQAFGANPPQSRIEHGTGSPFDKGGSSEDDLYQGEYIRELAEKHADQISDDARETGERFLKILLDEEIKPSVEKMGIQLDEYFSEASLRQGGELEKTLEFFKKKKLTYEKDGALFLKTSEYGDDKDRVIVKSDGEATYALPDLMYHKNKFERGYAKLIDIFGADHHGYVPRLKVGVKMLGFGDVEVVITQLVKLFRDGEEVRMSKRAGNFELMDDLIDEVGMDAARWFFVMRDWNTHLNFDLDLAKKQSSDNPVFYVQYAHTRMASILEKAKMSEPQIDAQPSPEASVGSADGTDDADKVQVDSSFAKATEDKSTTPEPANVELLTEQAEFDLIKKMSELPDLVRDVARNYAINTLTTYARELAETFHKFYEKCRVIDEGNVEVTKARLRLVAAAKEVLRIVLEDLVGVSAPKKM